MKHRILIVDDDEKVLALLRSSLQKSGYETLTALDGESALEQAKTEKPDLILADVAMPKMDGFELCKQIREDPMTAYIPFIFLTSRGELHDRVTGLSLGADDYISKPFHISEVTARIKSILQRTPALQAQALQDDGESALEGDLKYMSLAELIQTLQMTQKSGGLKIVNGPHVGKLYFDGGEIVDASLGPYKAEEAAYRILSWDEGFFEFDAHDTSRNPGITTTTTSLLMEGFDQREQYLKYKEAMPPFNSIVKFAEGEIPGSMNPSTQNIIDLIDEQRTIQEIVERSPGNYLLTVKMLYALLKKELIIAVEDLFAQDSEEQDYGQLAHELWE